jgi:hypothetical protein
MTLQFQINKEQYPRDFYLMSALGHIIFGS